MKHELWFMCCRFKHWNGVFSLFYEQQLREHFNRCGIYEAILVIYLYITGLWCVGGISQGK